MNARRVALLGFGRMGRVLAGVIGDAVPELEVSAIADPRPDLRDVAASVSPRARLVGRAKDALAEADACVIASPTPLHADQVAAALSAGLPVFCEKPLTLDPARSLALGAQAAERGLALQVGFYRRFAAPWRAVAAAVGRGAIGTPVLATVAFFDRSLPIPSFADPAVSGGLLVDNGIHELDALRWLLGPIADASMMPGPDPEGSLTAAGDLAVASVTLRFASGAIATLGLTRGLAGADGTRLEIVGTSGAIRIETAPRARAILTVAGVEHEIPGSAAQDYWREAIAEELRAFARGDADVPGAADSAAAVETAVRLRESITIERKP